MSKLFVILTPATEYHIYAMDTEDALNTFDGDVHDILSKAEYENAGPTDTIH